MMGDGDDGVVVTGGGEMSTSPNASGDSSGDNPSFGGDVISGGGGGSGEMVTLANNGDKSDESPDVKVVMSCGSDDGDVFTFDNPPGDERSGDCDVFESPNPSSECGDDVNNRDVMTKNLGGKSGDCSGGVKMVMSDGGEGSSGGDVMTSDDVSGDNQNMTESGDAGKSGDCSGITSMVVTGFSGDVMKSDDVSGDNENMTESGDGDKSGDCSGITSMVVTGYSGDVMSDDVSGDNQENVTHNFKSGESSDISKMATDRGGEVMKSDEISDDCQTTINTPNSDDGKGTNIRESGDNACGVAVVVSGGDEVDSGDGNESVVLGGDEDVFRILLKRKDSDLEEPTTPKGTPRKKKNSFIKIRLEEEEEKEGEEKEEGKEEDEEEELEDLSKCPICSGCPDEATDGESSPVKADRSYNGKGPPGRGLGPNITKSYSIEGSAPPVPPHHLPHAHPHHHHHHNGTHNVRRSQLQQTVSQGSGVGLGGRRGAPRGSAADDTANRNSRWRGSGAQGNVEGYELSQDFADMRLEMLERRYGGIVARRAAVTIQRAYRRYAMYKKFRSITATAKAQEKRLSRRFTVDVPEWGDAPSNQQFHDACNEFDQLQRNISASMYSEGRRPARSMSMRDTPRTVPPSSTITTTAATTTTTSTTRHHQDTYDLHDTLATLSDSSLYCHVPALSPLTPTSTATPAHTHVRNGSGDYQAHQNDRELKYFSEDSGMGSQEGVGNNRLSVSNQRRSSRTAVGKKIPPEVPRRTSSIKSNESSGSAESVPSSHRVQCHPPSLTPPSSTPSSLTSEGGHSDRGPLSRSADNGSLSSVQSSGSDSSLSQSTSDRATPLTNEQQENADYQPTSPVWKRKTQQMSTSEAPCEDKRLSQISENSEDSLQSHSSEGMTYSQTLPSQTQNSAHYAHHAHYTHTAHMSKVPEVVRKRQYRVGLNLFNKKPERGVSYLISRGFLENSPQAVAKFLLTRKGLSKQMIGEYLGNLQNNFNMDVLECFAHDIDLSGMQVDVALRKFQTHYRIPGEAQKIERLMKVFGHRYCQCNRDIVTKLRDPDTVFVLAFAIIMLNTDLHTASLKPEKRMKLEDFIKNLRGIDDGYDIEREMLEGMYQRIKAQEFRPGHDHVTQVLKVQQTMVEKKPNLALPHRRLVCYCRLYEIPDVTKKERVGVHQREVFLFNDLLVVTKIFSKKKNTVTYSFRQSFPLAGLAVMTREVPHYPYLMELRHRVDNKVLIIFNARNEHDRTKFCEDLKESICEMDEMESLRIEAELDRQKLQKASLRASRPNATAENRDSGVADMELLAGTEKNGGTLKADSTLKRTALSNSLLDIHETVH